MLVSKILQEIHPLDLRRDLVAYSGMVDFAGTRCQCDLSSWTLTPEQLIHWVESKHVCLVELLPTIRDAIAHWLPTNVYCNLEMPVDVATLLDGIYIENIYYRHNEDPRYRHPHGTTIEIMSNLRKNIDNERDQSCLSMVDIKVTLDENLTIRRIYCDG